MSGLTERQATARTGTRRVAIAVALAVAVVLGGLVAVLSQREPRLAGSNTFVEISGVALRVPPGGEQCARDQWIPAGATRARVYVGTFGRPSGPVAVVARAANRIVTQGRLRGGFPDGTPIVIPVARVHSDVPRATLCMRNLGRHPMQFAGNRLPIAGVRVDGPEEIRFDWLLPGSQTGWRTAARVDDRLPLFKLDPLASWSLWAMAAVLAGLWAAGILLYVRQMR